MTLHDTALRKIIAAYGNDVAIVSSLIDKLRDTTAKTEVFEKILFDQAIAQNNLLSAQLLTNPYASYRAQLRIASITSNFELLTHELAEYPCQLPPKDSIAAFMDYIRAARDCGLGIHYPIAAALCRIDSLKRMTPQNKLKVYIEMLEVFETSEHLP